MGIKSEKTFEEIVERIVAVFGARKGPDAHAFVDCDLDQNSHGESDTLGSPTSRRDDDGGHEGDDDSR
jgi:hypothetical protein